MSDCCTCRHAIWDSEEYYGAEGEDWFICGCKKDRDPDKCCDEYEEVEIEI